MRCEEKECGGKEGWGSQSNQVVKDLVPDNADHLKRLLRGERIDQHVSMDADEVFRVENAVLVLDEDFGISGLKGWCDTGHMHFFAISCRRGTKAYLSRSVDNFCREILCFVANDLAEGVFDGWVIALDEVAVDELHCERGFACMIPISLEKSFLVAFIGIGETCRQI